MIRPIRVEGDIACIDLTQGYTAIVDAVDLFLVDGFNWRANIHRRKDGTIWRIYAVSNVRVLGERRFIYMHRVVSGEPLGLVVDHRNGDGLDNRRSNIRVATYIENGQNLRKPTSNTSGAKGVSWRKTEKKWRAQITAFGKNYHLGFFESIEEAACAYSAASAKLHGEFGRVE
jgi:hypothetical protein